MGAAAPAPFSHTSQDPAHHRAHGLRIAVDELADGTLLAEIDDGDSPTQAIPDWLEVLAEVTAQERWTGASLAS